jgi:hypothetical protein
MTRDKRDTTASGPGALFAKAGEAVASTIQSADKNEIESLSKLQFLFIVSPPGKLPVFFRHKAGLMKTLRAVPEIERIV